MSFFFFNDTATTEIYTLSLHDALPISRRPPVRPRRGRFRGDQAARGRAGHGDRRDRCDAASRSARDGSGGGGRGGGGGPPPLRGPPAPRRARRPPPGPPGPPPPPPPPP